MYSEQIKKNCRTIITGLKGKKAYELLCAVDGQMSDGYWEESFPMRGYWLFDTIEKLPDDSVVILVSNAWGDIDFGKCRMNKWLNMSDQKIRDFFANKIKFMIKYEGLNWNRNNVNELTHYMSYDEDITVATAYHVYDVLKGRGAY